LARAQAPRRKANTRADCNRQSPEDLWLCLSRLRFIRRCNCGAEHARHLAGGDIGGAMTQQLKTCEWPPCGKQFEPKHRANRRARYCSPGCRLKAHRSVGETIIGVGETIIPLPYRPATIIRAPASPLPYLAAM